ncbi:MAG: hypothetical protein COT90_02750 [Candidatus Diapherotrites archaeon CG10_big_fil_rev_8_21_14_0_10_31_34]|nr:MAG: hypothetical protein COT90_02750 [Candidatus Diapherotrites archaeon CG10_big_fil_rev_8_21_14_0_10_31_34]
MLLLGVFGNFGVYSGMAGMMEEGHMFFSLTPVGIIFGIIEAGVMGFIAGYVIALVYNKFA